MTAAPGVDGELPGMDRRDPTWIIMGTWLIEDLGACNCASDGVYGHEQYCGLEAIIDLSSLPGWEEHLRVPDPKTIPARNSDPATSHAATKAIAMRAGSQRAILLEAFNRGEAITDEEAMNICDVSATSEYSKRCSELREAGLIVPTGDTRPGASGHERIISRITPQGVDWLRANGG